MEKLVKALATIAGKLHVTGVALAAARATWGAAHKKANREYDRQVKAGKRADQLRRQKKPKKAATFDRKALRHHRRSVAASIRAQAAVGDVKRLTQRRHELETDAGRIKKALADLQDDQGVKIIGNHAEGGTKRQRLKAVALAAAAACASGRRPNFYSQAGTWDVDHAISGEARGHRSDCSSFVTAVYKAADLDDPNRNDFRGGYTGTLLSHGKDVARGDLKPGDLIIYGTGVGHHVEMYVGPGVKTIGHGSAPVDAGVIDLLPGTKRFRSYV